MILRTISPAQLKELCFEITPEQVGAFTGKDPAVPHLVIMGIGVYFNIQDTFLR